MTAQQSPHHHHHNHTSNHGHHHHHQHHHHRHLTNQNMANNNNHRHSSRPQQLQLSQLDQSARTSRPVDVRIPAIEKYAYCLCLHVKPTTIFIAVFKLIRSLLFASILLNSEFTLNEQLHDSNNLAPATMYEDHNNRSTAIAVKILTRIITATVSAVGIYSVISGRAALLIPFYAMLLVDFFFALPVFYNRDLDTTFGDNLGDLGRNVGPYQGPMNGANEKYAVYSLMLFSTCVMIVKIYFLCVIWKCYRARRAGGLLENGHQHPYPIVRVIGGSHGSRFEDLEADLDNSLAPPPYDSIASNTMKPPNYEEAMKSSSSRITQPSNHLMLNQPAATIGRSNEQQLQTISSMVSDIHQNAEPSINISPTPPPQYDANPSQHISAQQTIISLNGNDHYSTSNGRLETLDASQVQVASVNVSASEDKSIITWALGSSNDQAQSNSGNDSQSHHANSNTTTGAQLKASSDSTDS